MLEQWEAIKIYDEYLKQRLMDIIQQGQIENIFDRQVSAEHLANMAYLIMKPYINPLLLQYNLDNSEQTSAQLLEMLLRVLR